MSGAALLLASAMAFQSQPAAPSPAALSTSLEQSPGPNGEGPRKPATTEAPHRVGLGGAMGGGSRGAGGSIRLFATKQLGLDMNVGWYRPTVGSTSQGSTFVAAPSFIWMLTKPHPQADVDLRPYVGGGANYSRGGSTIRSGAGGVNQVVRARGFGEQVFGGVELIFQDAKWLSINGEVAHYELQATGLTGAFARGTNAYLLFYFYMN